MRTDKAANRNDGRRNEAAGRMFVNGIRKVKLKVLAAVSPWRFDCGHRRDIGRCQPQSAPILF
jgi:hypothetical protein